MSKAILTRSTEWHFFKILKGSPKKVYIGSQVCKQPERTKLYKGLQNDFYLLPDVQVIGYHDNTYKTTDL